MKELFKLIGAQPVKPATKDMGDSESDYDEFDINLGNWHHTHNTRFNKYIVSMEGYIIYIIIGLVVFLIAVAGIWYYVSRN